MNQKPKLVSALRYTVLLAVVMIGLASIIGTGGGSSSSHKNTNGEGDTYYLDADGDGYGDPDNAMQSDFQPQGYVADNSDCDDNDAATNPGAVEVCGDEKDNNCDGRIDEGCVTGQSLVPDTGQTSCYDLGGEELTRCPSEGNTLYGQDGCYSINPPSFTKLSSTGEALARSASSWAMVKDNVTGLIWEVKTNKGDIHDWQGGYSWNDATDVFIAQLNAEQFGGFSDWRLPTKKELIYLVDYGAFYPAVDDDFFPHTALYDYYWTSTTTPAYPGQVWGVSFRGGTANDEDKTSEYFVRAVRGKQTYNLFTDNGDGTITHNVTGLMWMKATAEDKMIWMNALAWCEDLSLAGYDDWRLPTIKELESIVQDDVYTDLGIDATYFPDTQSSNYWSSTTRDENPNYAWHVSFSGIIYGYSYKTTFAYSVRAVRGGK